MPRYRWRAIIVQMASTTPKGQAPERNPYALDRPQPSANAAVEIDPRRSGAYLDIMNVSETTP